MDSPELVMLSSTLPPSTCKSEISNDSSFGTMARHNSVFSKDRRTLRWGGADSNTLSESISFTTQVLPSQPLELKSMVRQSPSIAMALMVRAWAGASAYCSALMTLSKSQLSGSVLVLSSSLEHPRLTMATTNNEINVFIRLCFLLNRYRMTKMVAWIRVKM